MMEECAFRKPPQCGASHLYAERDGEGEHTRIGADRNVIAGSTETASVTGDRFELRGYCKSTMPVTMGTVSTHQSVAVVGPPRDRTPRQYEGEVVVTRTSPRSATVRVSTRGSELIGT